jgi:LmbE family N-acetylglucosaminyl deacetylase
MLFPNARFRITPALVLISCVASAALAQPSRDTGDQTGERRAPSEPREAVDLVVVAPHPDDEALIASGVMLRAKQEGQRVAVIVMTNGDFDCQADGLVREHESVRGLAQLGIDEQDVYFLGYPDGHLARLGQTPLEPVRRLVDGICASGRHTYGDSGYGHADYHNTRFGSHAVYTVAQVLDDLTLLMQELNPRRVVVTHPNDTHPDHAASYTLVRRALKHLPNAPQLLRALVHTNDCWPTGEDGQQRCQPGRVAPNEAMPPLSNELSGYRPDVHVPVPPECLTATFNDNPKLRAISEHRSQTHDDLNSYLFAFARSEEVFFSETLDVGSKHRRVLMQMLVRPGALSNLQSKGPEVFRASTGEYTLEVSPAAEQASVSRHTPQGPKHLHRWPLPHDLLDDAVHFELRVEHVYADGTAELGLYAANELLGVTAVVGSDFKSQRPKSGQKKLSSALRVGQDAAPGK